MARRLGPRYRGGRFGSEHTRVKRELWPEPVELGERRRLDPSMRIVPRTDCAALRHEKPADDRPISHEEAVLMDSASGDADL